jgi:hypothetical protein
VARAEQLLLDRQRPPVEPLGLLVVAPGGAHGRQVVEVDGDLVVLGAEQALEQGQHSPAAYRPRACSTPPRLW